MKINKRFAMKQPNKRLAMKIMKPLIIALFLLSGAVHANNTNEVWLFSIKEQAFTQAYKLSSHWSIKHYLIDEGRDFESKISQGLSKHKPTAQTQIRQRFNKHKTSWVAQAKSAWQGAINAQSLNIEKVPAITFDKGKTLIYGVTDLSKALNIHRQEKSKQIK